MRTSCLGVDIVGLGLCNVKIGNVKCEVAEDGFCAEVVLLVGLLF